jgi:hypothetical protein
VVGTADDGKLEMAAS